MMCLDKRLLYVTKVLFILINNWVDYIYLRQISNGQLSDGQVSGVYNNHDKNKLLVRQGLSGSVKTVNTLLRLIEWLDFPIKLLYYEVKR